MNIRFSEPSPTGGSGRSEQGSQSSLSCDREATDLFMKKMEEKDPGRHDLESGERRNEDNDSSQGNFHAMAGMTSPLESLFSGRMEQAASVSAPATEIDSADLERLVERILVSTPENGGHEVRISLGSGSLLDTDIILQRDVNGMLSVTLTSANASSFQTLVSSRETLQSLLEKLEKNDVRVEVKQDLDRESNDQNRRSRGYMSEDQLML